MRNRPFEAGAQLSSSAIMPAHNRGSPNNPPCLN
jgi:hypothetical protein